MNDPANTRITEAISWLKGTDTGISSKTIWSVMTGFPVDWEGTPADPSDFGRCYRLLLRFPEWRPRLQEVADRHPEWQPLVDNWDEMTRIYLRDYPTGESQELYDLMRKMSPCVASTI